MPAGLKDSQELRPATRWHAGPICRLNRYHVAAAFRIETIQTCSLSFTVRLAACSFERISCQPGCLLRLRGAGLNVSPVSRGRRGR